MKNNMMIRFLLPLFFLTACTHSSAISELKEKYLEDSRIKISKIAPPQWEYFNEELNDQTGSWSQFDHRHLAELISVGLENNLTLQQVTQRVRTAFVNQEQVQRGLWPRLFIGGDGSVSSNSIDKLSLNGRFQYDLDISGAKKRRSIRSDIAVKQEKITLYGARISIAAAIASLYFDIITNDELISLQKQQINILKKQLRLTEVRVSTGSISRLSADQISVSIQQLIATLEAIKGQRNDQERQLSILLGKPPQSFRLKSTPLKLSEIPRLSPKSPIEVIARRPDIMLAELELLEAGLSVEDTRKAWLPSLVVTGNSANTVTRFSDVLNLETFAFSIASRLSFLLYDNGNRDYDKRRALINQDSTLISYERAILRSFDEIESVLNRQERNIRQFETLKLQEKTQKRVTKITSIQYKTGSASAFDLIREQNNELIARRSRLINWSDGMKLYIIALEALAVEPNPKRTLIPTGSHVLKPM